MKLIHPSSLIVLETLIATVLWVIGMYTYGSFENILSDYMLQFALMLVPLTGMLLSYIPLVSEVNGYASSYMRVMQQLGFLCWVIAMVIWIIVPDEEEHEMVLYVADYLFNFAPIFWALAVFLWGRARGFSLLKSSHFFTVNTIVPLALATFASTILFFFGLQGDGTVVEEPFLSLFSVTSTSLVVFLGTHVFFLSRTSSYPSQQKGWYLMFLIGCVLYLLADLQELIARSKNEIFDGSLSDLTFLYALMCIAASFLHFDSTRVVVDAPANEGAQSTVLSPQS